MVEPISAIIGLVALGVQAGIKINDFVSAASECHAVVTSIADDLDGVMHILRSVENAMIEPAGAGKYSLAHKRAVFDPLYAGMSKVLVRLAKHMKSYTPLNYSVQGRAKNILWAATGQKEARNLAVELSHHKATLCGLMQVDLGENVALIAHGVAATHEQVSYVRDGQSSMRRNVHRIINLVSHQSGNPMFGIPMDSGDVVSTYEFDAPALQNANVRMGAGNTSFNTHGRRNLALESSTGHESEVNDETTPSALAQRRVVASCGIDTLYEGSGSVIDIFAVHGLSANSQSAWTCSTGQPEDVTQQSGRSVHWLRDGDMLPSELPAARIMAFNYDSTQYGTSSAEEWYTVLARSLLAHILAVREGEKYKARPIVFICHSLGGLVVEQALAIAGGGEAQYDSIQQCTTGVMFLGTPHAGSNPASMATALSRIADVFGLASEQPAPNPKADAALLEVVHRFMSWTGRSSVDLTCFYETMKTSYGTRFGRSWEEIAVTEQSACLPGHRKVPLATNHLRLNKYRGRTDPSYQLVLSTVLDMARAAPNKIEHRFEPREWRQDNSGIPAVHLECQKALFVGWPKTETEGLQRRLGMRTSQTCEWLTRNGTYGEWLNGESPQILRLEGLPGTSKSQLALFVLEYLSLKLTFTADMTLAVHMCDNRNMSSSTAQAVMRQILFQLFQQRPKHFHFLQKAYDIGGNKLFQDFRKLTEIFQEILTHWGDGEIFILIDGLDECDAMSRSLLSELLVKLSKRGDRVWPVHLLFTHRPERDIIRAYSGVEGIKTIRIQLGDENLQKDLDRYRQDKVMEVCKKHGWGVKEELLIKSELKRRSEGSFLWCARVVEDIDNVSRKSDIRRCLNYIPGDLVEVYQRITYGYHLNNTASAKMVLSIIAAARRPLRQDELALAYLLAQDSPDQWDRRTLPTAEDLAEFDDIMDVCGCLVRLDEATGTVRLIHETAREYVLSDYLGQDAQTVASNDLFLQIIFRMFSMETFDYLVGRQGDQEEKLVFGHPVFKQDPPAAYVAYFFEEWEAHAHAVEKEIPTSAARWLIYLKLRPSLLESWVSHAYDTNNNPFANWLLEQDEMDSEDLAASEAAAARARNSKPEVEVGKPSPAEPIERQYTRPLRANFDRFSSATQEGEGRISSTSSTQNYYNGVKPKDESVKLVDSRRASAAPKTNKNTSNGSKLSPTMAKSTTTTSHLKPMSPKNEARKHPLASETSSFTQPATNNNIWDVSDEASDTEDTEYLDPEETLDADSTIETDPELEEMVRLFIRMMSEFTQKEGRRQTKAEKKAAKMSQGIGVQAP